MRRMIFLTALPGPLPLPSPPSSPAATTTGPSASGSNADRSTFCKRVNVFVFVSVCYKVNESPPNVSVCVRMCVGACVNKPQTKPPACVFV